MKILVTADLHLSEEEPERLEVWSWILEQAEKRDVDALLIAGDLFESASDGSALNGEVQTTLEERLPNGCDVVMVAGNHDPNLGRLGWSAVVHVLERGESVRLQGEEQNLRIHGLPYSRGEAATDLTDRFDLSGEETDWLLGHASYLSPAHRHIVQAIEDHGEENECLLYEQDVVGTEFDRVILGHWHGQAQLGEDPPVHYPGSPLPNSIREEGRRALLEFELEQGQTAVRPIPVDTPPGWYYRREEVLMLPGFEEEGITRLDTLLGEGDSGCRLRVSVDGFVEGDITRIRDRLQDLSDEHRDNWNRLEIVDMNLQGAEGFDQPLVRRSLEALRQREPAEHIDLAEDFSKDPSAVRSRARSMLEEEAESVRRRAQELLMRALYEVVG